MQVSISRTDESGRRRRTKIFLVFIFFKKINFVAIFSLDARWRIHFICIRSKHDTCFSEMKKFFNPYLISRVLRRSLDKQFHQKKPFTGVRVDWAKRSRFVTVLTWGCLKWSPSHLLQRRPEGCFSVAASCVTVEKGCGAVDDSEVRPDVPFCDGGHLMRDIESCVAGLGPPPASINWRKPSPMYILLRKATKPSRNKTNTFIINLSPEDSWASRYSWRLGLLFSRRVASHAAWHPFPDCGTAASALPQPVAAAPPPFPFCSNWSRPWICQPTAPSSSQATSLPPFF